MFELSGLKDDVIGFFFFLLFFFFEILYLFLFLLDSFLQLVYFVFFSIAGGGAVFGSAGQIDLFEVEVACDLVGLIFCF